MSITLYSFAQCGNSLVPTCYEHFLEAWFSGEFRTGDDDGDGGGSASVNGSSEGDGVEIVCGYDGDWKTLIREIWFWRFGQYDVDE
ncbi:hypothetical protein NC652_003599 [Populus alba x Populus x berolinensis]|nr:hypothetical protein NC652_003599 [Populus alba x Populus x berolinensis]